MIVAFTEDEIRRDVALEGAYRGTEVDEAVRGLHLGDAPTQLGQPDANQIEVSRDPSLGEETVQRRPAHPVQVMIRGEEG